MSSGEIIKPPGKTGIVSLPVVPNPERANLDSESDLLRALLSESVKAGQDNQARALLELSNIVERAKAKLREIPTFSRDELKSITSRFLRSVEVELGIDLSDFEKIIHDRIEELTNVPT